MFCKGFLGKLRAAYKKFDDYVQAHVAQALAITSNIKAFLESPLAMVLTAIIPTDVDEVVRKQLVAALGKAIDVLSIVDTCKEHTSVDDKLLCFIQEINKRSPELQQALLIKLASIISRELDGNRYAQNLYDVWVQGKYSSTK